MIEEKIFLGIIIFIIVSDIVLIILKRKTWSEIASIWNIGNYPMTGFCCMMVATHWSIPALFETPLFVAFIILIVNSAVVQFIRWKAGKPFPKWITGLIALSGGLHGWLFWGQ